MNRYSFAALDQGYVKPTDVTNSAMPQPQDYGSSYLNMMLGFPMNLNGLLVSPKYPTLAAVKRADPSIVLSNDQTYMTEVTPTTPKTYSGLSQSVGMETRMWELIFAAIMVLFVAYYVL